VRSYWSAGDNHTETTTANATFEVTGWKGGRSGSTLGLRFGRENAREYVNPSWPAIQVALDGVFHVFPITSAFWRDCPEVRGAPITEWLTRHQLAPWLRGQPPRLSTVHLGGNRFRPLVPGER